MPPQVAYNNPMENDYLKDQTEEIDRRIEEARQLALQDPGLKNMVEDEIRVLEREKSELAESAQTSMDSHSPDSPDLSDEVNPNVAILEIRSAAGGNEAGLFAGDLLRMYLRFAEKQRWGVEELDRSEGGLGQIKQVILKIKGKSAFTELEHESGVHRVQRVPKTESSGRIHTSTATVAILPEVKESEVFINPSELEFEAYRSGGKGGQNVNKVSTAVRIKHIPSGIVVTAQTKRSQLQNRENAMNLLRAKLWEIQREQNQSEVAGARSEMVGTGERNEKVRTYNFPQNRVTDHRIGKSWHNLEDILDGALELIIKALQEANGQT